MNTCNRAVSDEFDNRRKELQFWICLHFQVSDMTILLKTVPGLSNKCTLFNQIG